jgi:hypothetical protein
MHWMIIKESHDRTKADSKPTPRASVPRKGRTVVDGPFAETKEWVAGSWVAGAKRQAAGGERRAIRTASGPLMVG